ncbi:MAG TPA: hypothetical protein VJ819_07980 [Nocardioidaceae bacterium]|nr:hypothetical protein [Nocardioidaceae bacterium]
MALIVAVPEPDDEMATEKAPVELFAGIVTVLGTVASAGLLLARLTAAPPLGVNPEKNNVADVWVVPVCTVDGLREIDSSVVPELSGGGVTVIEAVRVSPL